MNVPVQEHVVVATHRHPRSAHPGHAAEEEQLRIVGGPDTLQHRVPDRIEGGERLVLAGGVGRPVDQQRVGEDVLAVVEDERDDPGAEPGRCELPGQVGDGHHLREHAGELAADPERRVVEHHRGSERMRPERGPPCRPRLRCPAFNPPHDLGTVRPVLRNRLHEHAPPSPHPPPAIDDADARDLRGRAQQAEDERVQRLLVVEVDAAAPDLLHRPSRLLLHRLKLRFDPAFEPVHERLGTQRHEPAGVLRRARQPEVEGDAHRERDQRTGADHRDDGDREPVAGCASGHRRLSPARRRRRRMLPDPGRPLTRAQAPQAWRRGPDVDPDRGRWRPRSPVSVPPGPMPVRPPRMEGGAFKSPGPWRRDRRCARR